MVITPQPTLLTARKLTLIDPIIVAKYLTHLHCSMKEHDIFHRTDTLHHTATHLISPRMMEEYEAIDELVGKLMDAAEDNCRVIHTGTIPWSPAYKHACRTLEYWLKRRSYINRQYHNSRYLSVLQNKLALKCDATLSKKYIEAKVSKAGKVTK